MLRYSYHNNHYLKDVRKILNATSTEYEKVPNHSKLKTFYFIVCANGCNWGALRSHRIKNMEVKKLVCY